MIQLYVGKNKKLFATKNLEMKRGRQWNSVDYVVASKRKKRLSMGGGGPPNEGSFQVDMRRLEIPEWAEVPKRGNGYRQMINPFTFNINQVGSLPMADILAEGRPEHRMYDPELNGNTAYQKISGITLKPMGGGGGGKKSSSKTVRIKPGKSIAEESNEVGESLGEGDLEGGAIEGEPIDQMVFKTRTRKGRAKDELRDIAQELRDERELDYDRLDRSNKERRNRFKQHSANMNHLTQNKMAYERNLPTTEKAVMQQRSIDSEIEAKKHRKGIDKDYNDMRRADEVRAKNRAKRMNEGTSHRLNLKKEKERLSQETEKAAAEKRRHDVKDKLGDARYRAKKEYKLLKGRESGRQLKLEKNKEKIEKRSLRAPKIIEQKDIRDKGKEKVDERRRPPTAKERDERIKGDEGEEKPSPGKYLVKRPAERGGNYEIRDEFKEVNRRSKEADHDRLYTQEHVNAFLEQVKDHLREMSNEYTDFPKLQKDVNEYINFLKGAPHVISKNLRSIIPILATTMSGAQGFFQEGDEYDRRKYKKFVRSVKNRLSELAERSSKKYLQEGGGRRFWKHTIAERKAAGIVRRRKNKNDPQVFSGRKADVKMGGVTFRKKK